MIEVVAHYFLACCIIPALRGSSRRMCVSRLRTDSSGDFVHELSSKKRHQRLRSQALKTQIKKLTVSTLLTICTQCGRTPQSSPFISVFTFPKQKCALYPTHERSTPHRTSSGAEHLYPVTLSAHFPLKLFHSLSS